MDSSPSSAEAMSVTLSDVVPAKPEEAKHMQPRVIELLDSIAHAVQSQQVLMDTHMRKYLQRPIAKIGCSGMASTLLQYAWYHDCRGVQKESWRFPKKHVLKNTVASGGADVANLLHRLHQLVCYPSSLSQHSI